MRRGFMSVLGTTVAVVLIIAGLLVVGYFILIGIALANFGSNK
jgi:hypothetical protein